MQHIKNACASCYSGQIPDGGQDGPAFPALRMLNASNNSLWGGIPSGLQTSGLFQQACAFA